MKIIRNIWNFILHPIKSLNKRSILKKLKERIEGKGTESILEILLEAMSLVFYFDKDYRRNIIGFKGAYQFQDKKENIKTGIRFEDNKMKVKKDGVTNPNIAVTFKDSETLRSFLFSKNPDILNYVLENSVSYSGNLNYLLKFAYMAKHLQLQILK